MSNKETKPGSLYMTYGYDGKIYHVSRIGEGTTGFLQYMRNEMYGVLRSGRIPDYWMGHYDFPDQSRIPPIRPERLNGYLNAVSEAAQEYGGKSLHTVNMRNAFFCYLKKIVPLTPAAETAALAARPDYPKPTDGYGAHIPQPDAFLPEYKSYQGMLTDKGLLIFSYGTEGQRQRRMYEDFIENKFFDPVIPDGKLKYYEIIGEPAQMQPLEDRLAPHSEKELLSGFKKAFVKADILEQGRCLQEFDLMKSIENLRIFKMRNQPQNILRKKFMDRSVKELFSTLRDSFELTKKERVECLQASQYPDESRFITLKMNR